MFAQIFIIACAFFSGFFALMAIDYKVHRDQSRESLQALGIAAAWMCVCVIFILRGFA